MEIWERQLKNPSLWSELGSDGGPFWLVDSEIGSSQLGSSNKEIHPDRLIAVSIKHLIRVIRWHIFRGLENTQTYSIKSYKVLHYCFFLEDETEHLCYKVLIYILSLSIILFYAENVFTSYTLTLNPK